MGATASSSSSAASRGSSDRSSSTLTNNYPASRNRMTAPSIRSQDQQQVATSRPSPATTSSTLQQQQQQQLHLSGLYNHALSAAPPTTISPPSTITNTNTNNIISGPGAYSISQEGAGPTQVYRVQIPSEVRAGQEFQVICGSRTVRVRCPTNSRGGQYLQITVPPEPIVRPSNAQGRAVLTSATPGGEGGGAVPMSDVVARGNAMAQQQQQQQQQQPQSSGRNALATNDTQPAPQTTYMVTVPPGISPGMQFAVDVQGERMIVTCPANVQAGMNLRILPTQRPTTSVPPNNLRTIQGTSLDRPPEQQPQHSTSSSSIAPPTTPPIMQMFEVVVPPGVMPNQSFSLLANGQRVLLTCPPNIRPGQKIRFKLPISNSSSSPTSNKDAPTIQLEYESIKDGWARTLRVPDMKFQWVRMNKDGEIDDDYDNNNNMHLRKKRFDVKHSAYTRQLAFMEGNDPRMRTGTLIFGAANESSVDSAVEHNGRVVVAYAEIATAHQRSTFDEKVKWFQEICTERLRVKWSDGHLRMVVRRSHLLHDSLEAVMSLSRMDLNKIWRFEFMDEMGIDAGGLAREWFQLLTEEIFNPDMGLWLPSVTNQMAMRINPSSEISCPEDHLIYFRFLGRVMGKALFDGHLVSGHMVRHMYKHLLGWPIMFEDLELPDVGYYNSLKSLLDVENVEDMYLDFTFTENEVGENRVVELVPGGANIPVTNDNLPEFLEANLKYHLMDRVKPQLTELLLGFFDVIPESLLTIFDFQELELLMCGLPVIDIDDWMKYTTYQGYFEKDGEMSQTCQWFWEVVREEFDQETRARLLQFVTGTSGVPSRGFSVLQGSDGNIRQFCMNGIKKEQSFYPRSHTCFNRIDLPLYDTKDELREKLKTAVATSATGFDIE